MSKKLTIEEFLNKANKVHNFIYDYSLVKYVNYHTNIKIICNEHGVFEQNPINHLSGKNGCPKCFGGVRHSLNDFIIKAEKYHGKKYDYSLVKYINARTKVDIICKDHGVFEQVPEAITILIIVYYFVGRKY